MNIPDYSQYGYYEVSVHCIRDFYRLWFSHPSVENITWWNFADQTATPAENKWNADLLDRNLKPKPSYLVLNEMINREWKTILDNLPYDGGVYRFKGFFGTYKVTIQMGGKYYEKDIHLSEDGPREFIIQLE